MGEYHLKLLNMRKILALILFCVMAVVVSAQSGKKLPSAVLVHKTCSNCQSPKYDTLCHFSYDDITLTDDSITFRDMECIYYHDDKNNPNRVSYLSGTYLVFSFPDGWKYNLELFSYYSSFYPVYARILYRNDFGNTLSIKKRFFQKDWSKGVTKLVKKWNHYAP